MTRRLEFLDPTTAYLVMKLVDGRESRHLVTGTALVRARAQVAAELDLEQARSELAQMTQRAQQPPAPPEWHGARPPAAGTAVLPANSDAVSLHRAAMQRIQTRITHPEL